MNTNKAASKQERFPQAQDELVAQVRNLLYNHEQTQVDKRRIVFIVADFYEENNEVVARLVDSCVRGDVPIKPSQVQWLKDKLVGALNNLLPREQD